MRETVKSAEWRVAENQNAQPHETWMGWHAHYALSQCHVRHCCECRETWENVTCEGVLFTLPVSCSRLPSAVNDLATTNLKKSSTSGHSTATMKYWMKKTTNVISDTGRKELVQVALLRFIVVTASRKSDRSFIGALLPDLFSEIYQFFWDLSHSSEDGQ